MTEGETAATAYTMSLNRGRKRPCWRARCSRFSSAAPAPSPYREHLATIAMANTKRTFWSPNWSRTRDHGSVLNGTDRHARPIFAIQINTSRDKTKRPKRPPRNFQCGAFHCSAYSRWLQRTIWFNRFRASPCAAPNVGMIVGPERRNANHIMISIGLGGHSLRHFDSRAASPSRDVWSPLPQAVDFRTVARMQRPAGGRARSQEPFRRCRSSSDGRGRARATRRSECWSREQDSSG